MKFLQCNYFFPTHIDAVNVFFFTKVYIYIYKHFLRITHIFLYWRYFFIRDPQYLDFLTNKIIITIIFPYKIFFIKKKKYFNIKLVFNTSYIKKKQNIYFFYIIFKMLNLRLKIYFFSFLLLFFKTKQLDFFQLIMKN